MPDSIISDSKLFIGSSDGDGWLTEIKQPINTFKYWYKRTPFRILTAITFLMSQFVLFYRLAVDKNIKKNTIIYINTLLPFGAALYGYVTRKPIVYHIHEASIEPRYLKFFLLWVCSISAKKIIYVSNYLEKTIPFPFVTSSVVYSALPIEFTDKAFYSRYLHRRDHIFRVLMLSSLRDYKGIPEFLEIVNFLSFREDIYFELVLSETEKEVNNFILKYLIQSYINYSNQYTNTYIITLTYK